MVNQGYAKQGLAISLAMLLHRLSPALIVVLSLLGCMTAYGVSKTQEYDALIIISALLGLILFRNGQHDELYASRNNWNMAATVAGTIAHYAVLISIVEVFSARAVVGSSLG